MKNSRLNSFKKFELEEFLHFIVANLFSNPDFIFVYSGVDNIPDYFKTIFNDENITYLPIDHEKFKMIEQFHFKRVDVTKKECAQMIDYILNTDYLLEAFCLGYVGSNESLYEFIEMIGYVSNYESLTEDDIFLKRRKYTNLLVKYIKAAVNLYGIINISEVADIIELYEQLQNTNITYRRESGNYKDTLFASPKYFSVPLIYAYAQSFASNIILTHDGYFLSPVFIDEYRKEFIEVMSHENLLINKNYNKYMNFIHKLEKKYSYRRFYHDNSDKVLYLPEREIFLNHADNLYNEQNEAISMLEKYLLATFTNRFKVPEELAFFDDEELFNVKSVLSDLAYDMANICSDKNAALKTSVEYSVGEICRFLNGFGIRIKKDEKIQLSLLLNVLSDHVRNWKNRGFTNDELERLDEIDNNYLDDYIDSVSADSDNPLHIIIPNNNLKH